MNVLVISNAYPSVSHQGGIFVENQVRCLSTLRLNVITLVRKGLKSRTYLPFWIKNFLFVFSRKYDLVHAHYGFHSALIAAVMKRRPLVTTFHGSDALTEPLRNRLYFLLQKFVVSRSDHIIAVSNEVKDVLVSRLDADPSKISVISCGVDTTFFAPAAKADARKELGIDESEKVVLFVGHINHNKGIDILRECARLMPDVTFVVLGKGTFEAGTRNCKVVGNHPNDRIPRWINGADVLILPSRSEGTPVVLMEALSCGIPVVASRVGGIPDLVKDGQTGCLVEKGDVAMFERKLRELLADSDKCRRMGRQGRKDMIENYDGRRVAERIERVYEKVLSNWRSKGKRAH